MSQPTKYERSKDFTVDYGDNTDHNALNSEFDAAASSINEIRTNLALLQRDDGKLKQGVVTADSVDPTFISEISAGVVDQVQGYAADAQASAVSATAAATTAVSAANTAVTSRDSASASANAATLASQSAAGSASAALASQTAAAASQTAAAASQTSASTSATSAGNSATSAGNSATTATAQAGIATTKAGEAAVSAAGAAASLADFKGRYFGPLANDPALDPNGNALDIGDLYANTTTGELRRYGSGGWVTAFGGIPNDGTVTYAKLDPDMQSGIGRFHGLLLNGNGAISQRGARNAAGYFRDRWIQSTGVTNVAWTADGQFENAFKLNANGDQIEQRVEQYVVRDAWSSAKYIAVSFYADCDTAGNVSVLLDVPNTKNVFSTVTNAYTDTFSMSTGAAWVTKLYQLPDTAFQRGLKITVRSAGAVVKVSGIKADPGRVFLPRFDARIDEIEFCRRYFNKTFPDDVNPANGAGQPNAVSCAIYGTSPGFYNGRWQYGRAMRATPAFTAYSYTGVTGNWVNGGGTNASAPGFSQAGDKSVNIFLNNGSVFTPGGADIFYIHATADAEL